MAQSQPISLPPQSPSVTPPQGPRAAALGAIAIATITDISIDSENDHHDHHLPKRTTSSKTASSLPQNIVKLKKGKEERSKSTIARVMTLQPVKHQVKDFSIDLDSSDTLGSSCCVNYRELCPEPIKRRWKKVLFLSIFIGFISWIFSNTVNSIWWKSRTFDVYSMFAISISLILLSLQINKTIAQKGLESFVVWYKCCNAGIAILSRLIYYNFWQDLENNDPYSKTNKTITCYFSVFIVIPTIIGTFDISCFSGYKAKKSIKKRIIMLCGVMVCTFWWFEMYTDEYRDLVGMFYVCFCLLL